MLKCDYRTAGTRFGAAEPGFGRSIRPAHVAAARRRHEHGGAGTAACPSSACSIAAQLVVTVSRLVVNMVSREVRLMPGLTCALLLVAAACSDVPRGLSAPESDPVRNPDRRLRERFDDVTPDRSEVMAFRQRHQRLDNLASDRATLMALYRSRRRVSEGVNWSSLEPLSAWHGVATDEDGRVERLELSGGPLFRGPLPPEIGNLTNLKVLNLSRQMINGEIPLALGHLANLEVLDLSRTGMSGEIPSEIGNLTNLRVLNLSHNRIHGEIPLALGHLSNLEVLNLSYNRMSGEIPSEIGNLTNLRVLGLSHNRIRGEIPLALGHLANLERLILDPYQPGLPCLPQDFPLASRFARLQRRNLCLGAAAPISAIVFRDCAVVCPEMVVLPGGDLALGRYEVTVGEYRAFTAALALEPDVDLEAVLTRRRPLPGPGLAVRLELAGKATCRFSLVSSVARPVDRHPVTCVSWAAAQEYVSWLSRWTGTAYRLPTEEEWERGVAGEPQPRSDGCYDRDRHYDRYPNRTRCPVGLYGSNGAGLSDMDGNVWEWTAECADGDCSRRVLRGGPDARRQDETGQRDWKYGFRVVRTLDAPIEVGAEVK